MNYDKFKQEFWQWFDSLPVDKKEKYWYYGYDIAETNFDILVYSKKCKQ